MIFKIVNDIRYLNLMKNMVNTLNNTPFYLNWTFWSFVVAFLALIVSLLPKVILLFKGKKVDLEVNNRVSINHWLGIPNINIFLGISNKGRSKIKIRSLELIISKENKQVANLKCNGFFETISSQEANLFFPFELPSENSWDHNCWFSVDVDRNTEQNIRGLLSKLSMDISEKTRISPQVNQLLEAEEGLVTPLINFKDKTFMWEPGEYFVEMKLHTEPQVKISKSFRFTLYETDTNELKAYSDDYKYGMMYSSTKNKGINIPISENSSKK